jgi:osmoprotectant transport system substrate-binding protein
MKHTTKFLALAALGFVLTFAVAACGDDDDGGGGGGNLDGASFSVGSKEFTEQLILGQIAAVALENAGATVDTQGIGIVGSGNVRTALTSGEIDMYWEYTGTGWSSHLGREISDAPGSPDELADAVREADAENGVVWFDTAPLNNTYAIVTLTSRGEDLGVSTLSDYAELVARDPEAASLCAATEWLDRADGFPGLAEAYGFDLPEGQITEFADTSGIAALVAQGDDCNFGELFATDGTIAANDLVVLEDDENFNVPYNVALNVRSEVNDEYGDQLRDIFNPISELLTDEVMQGLNARVDADGEEPRAVAQSFLSDNGLLEQ